MDINIEFNQAVFEHNISEEDMRRVFDTARYDDEIEEEDSENKYLVIGFDWKAGTYLPV